MSESAPSPIDRSSALVGQRIRTARLERGWTLARLGGDDLSRSFLSSVEHGRCRISLRSLDVLARRLGLPISHFLEPVPADDQETDSAGHEEFPECRLEIRGNGGSYLEVTIRGGNSIRAVARPDPAPPPPAASQRIE